MSVPPETRIAAAVAAAIDALRDRQIARFGWTHVDVRAEPDASTRTVHLYGQLVAARFAGRVTEAVRRALPPQWSVDGTALQGLAGTAWHSLPREVTSLYAAIARDGRDAALATQLRRDDGPVHVMATHEGWTLVRAIDGTLGWCAHELGPACAAVPIATDGLPSAEAMLRAVRARLGAPYLLGGTTLAGIDCSGLVQRGLRAAAHGWVPRHTTDQLAIDPRPDAGPDHAGDLVFVWSSVEAPGHVGIADGGGRIVHASRHRGVVDDPRERFLAKADRTMHVPWDAVVALQTRIAGHTCLADVFELGRHV